MKRSPSAVSGKALKAFRRRKVMNLGEVAELVHSSIHTARRRLKEWQAHTSYNQNGRYYALPDVPEFDADGLSCQVVQRGSGIQPVQQTAAGGVPALDHSVL